MSENEEEIVEKEGEGEIDYSDLPLQERAEASLNLANEIHQNIAEYKEWSVETAADLRSRAEILYEMDELSEAERDEIQQAAQQIRTVYQRLDVN